MNAYVTGRTSLLIYMVALRVANHYPTLMRAKGTEELGCNSIAQYIYARQENASWEVCYIHAT